MQAAVISYTEKGRLLSLKIGTILPDAKRFCFHSHTDELAETFNTSSVLVEKLWSIYDAVIFCCACGIAVRNAAPFVRSKLTDPAVIVIDDCGKFVIPILSGHIGGANALAEMLAEKLDSQSVITTATDTGGHFSPDSFAAANNLIITDISAAKAIACAVLDGEDIGLVSEYQVRNLPKEIKTGTACRYGIYIGRNADLSPFPLTLKLIPKNIVVGIGCRKDTSAEAIAETVENALRSADILPERVCMAASVDLKSQEKGLLDFCSQRSIDIAFYTASQLAEAEGEFSSSAFVRSVTGIDNICERAAVLHSRGKLIMRKFAENGVTAAAAEINTYIDFERKML